MPRAIDVFKLTAIKPIEAIESLIAIVMMVFGLYLASPWYVNQSGTAVGQSVADSLFLHVFIALVFFIIPALPVIAGLFFKRFATRTWRKRGTFLMAVGLIFLTLLRLVTIGFTPFIWLFTLGLGLIAGVCYLYVSHQMR